MSATTKRPGPALVYRSAHAACTHLLRQARFYDSETRTFVRPEAALWWMVLERAVVASTEATHKGPTRRWIGEEARDWLLGDAGAPVLALFGLDREWVHGVLRKLWATCAAEA